MHAAGIHLIIAKNTIIICCLILHIHYRHAARHQLRSHLVFPQIASAHLRSAEAVVLEPVQTSSQAF